MNSLIETYPRFTLDDELSGEQIQFFNANGYIHFKKFITPLQVQEILDALAVLQKKWVDQDVKQVNGIPIRYGFDDKHNKIVHRFAFTSLHCDEVHQLLKSPKLKALVKLLNMPGARIAENEKDGVVVNQYINAGSSKMKQMGWHTDSLRDIFYAQKVMPMLNVGICLTDSKKEQGGLKVLPGTHKQTLYNMLFKKPYYVNNEPDKNEVSIETDAGDLTVHHGHIWHRVATAPVTGRVSRRISMYIPIVCGKYMPKHEKSLTPFYHRMNIFAKK